MPAVPRKGRKDGLGPAAGAGIRFGPRCHESAGLSLAPAWIAGPLFWGTNTSQPLLLWNLSWFQYKTSSLEMTFLSFSFMTGLQLPFAPDPWQPTAPQSTGMCRLHGCPYRH